MFDPQRFLEQMACVQPADHLRNKLVRALERLSPEELEVALATELETVRSDYEAIPERERWQPVLRGLQSYFTALELLLDAVQDHGQVPPDVRDEALALAMEADRHFQDQEETQMESTE